MREINCYSFTPKMRRRTCLGPSTNGYSLTGPGAPRGPVAPTRPAAPSRPLIPVAPAIRHLMCNHNSRQCYGERTHCDAVCMYFKVDINNNNYNNQYVNNNTSYNKKRNNNNYYYRYYSNNNKIIIVIHYNNNHNHSNTIYIFITPLR